MRQGDIYMVSLDPAVGKEQQGHRPVLIVSSNAFNAASKLPIILPVTSGGNFARAMGMSVSLTGAGTRTSGVVRCDQPRIMDLIARGARRIESVPPSILQEVLMKLTAIFE